MGVRKNPYVAKGKAFIKLKKLRKKGKTEKANKWKKKMDEVFKGHRVNKMDPHTLMEVAKANRRNTIRSLVAGPIIGSLNSDGIVTGASLRATGANKRMNKRGAKIKKQALKNSGPTIVTSKQMDKFEKDYLELTNAEQMMRDYTRKSQKKRKR